MWDNQRMTTLDFSKYENDADVQKHVAAMRDALHSMKLDGYRREDASADTQMAGKTLITVIKARGETYREIRTKIRNLAPKPPASASE